MSISGALVVTALTAGLAVLIGLAFIKPLRKWASAGRGSYVRPLGIVGLLGGIVALILILLVGDTFGFPGSRAYRTYELFNRSMSFILASQSCAIVAFLTACHDRLTNFEQRLIALIMGGWMAMALGTAAEFWLFSGQPYGQINLRSFSFGLFSMGSLVAGLTMLVLGFRILRGRRVTRLLGLIFILYLPLDIASFVFSISIFMAPAAGAIAIALATLKGSWNPTLDDGPPD